MFRSHLLSFVMLFEIKRRRFRISTTWSCSEIHWCASSSCIKAISHHWFPRGDTQMKQLLYHHSLSLVLCHSFIRVWNIRDLETNALHVQESGLSVETDYSFMLTHFLDVTIESVGCLVSAAGNCLLFLAGPRWGPSSSLGEPLKRCLHMETLHIVHGASLFRGFFSQLPQGFCVWGQEACGQRPVWLSEEPEKSRLRSAGAAGRRTVVLNQSEERDVKFKL